MLNAVEIERATEKEAGVFRGNLGGFSWDISESWNQGGAHYKIGVSRPGVRGSRKTVATRANWQNAAQIIADFINKQAKEAK